MEQVDKFYQGDLDLGAIRRMERMDELQREYRGDEQHYCRQAMVDRAAVIYKEEQLGAGKIALTSLLNQFFLECLF